MGDRKVNYITIIIIIIFLLTSSFSVNSKQIKNKNKIEFKNEKTTYSLYDSSIDVTATDDATVIEGYPNNNYGNSPSLYVQSGETGYKDERAWLKFNLNNEIPYGSTIISAKLVMHLWNADDTNDLEVSVHGSFSDAWTESDITWDTQPTYESEEDSVILEANQEDLWIELDVTSFIKFQWNQDKIISLVLKASIESTPTVKTYAFSSKEYSEFHAPRLLINYNGNWNEYNSFTILHYNDAHSRLLTHDLEIPAHDNTNEFELVGGAAYFTTKLLDLKSKHPDSLILDAGDVFEGGVLGDLRGGGGTIDWYNLMNSKLKSLGGRGIDAVVIGNHELRSKDILEEFKYNATFPVVSINICNEGTMTPYYDPYTIVTINGTKIGIIGYTHDEETLSLEAELYLDIVSCVWSDNNPLTIDIKGYVEYLRDTQYCDVVIFLSHIGHSRMVSGDLQLIEDDGNVEPPEIIVAGHWHTMTDSVWQPYTLGGKTLLIEAASYLQFIGELRVNGFGKYISSKKHPIRVKDINPDSDVISLISSLMEEYNNTSPDYYLEDVVGYSDVDLRLDKDKWWTMNEYPWSGDSTAGEWICDAMQWKAENLGYSCDLAVQSGGGIRRDIKAGPITYREIFETYPWSDDKMVLVYQTGQQLWEYIEEKYCGPAISKDWQVFADDGEIKEIFYNSYPINPQSQYLVAISEYMYYVEQWSGTTIFTGESIREGIVEYTSQYTQSNPMTVVGPRYFLNTEFSIGADAVVTMINQGKDEPYYDCIFVRLLNASDDSIDNRGTYVPPELVKEDGSINIWHQFSESMVYRGHLGFQPGLLHVGDVIRIYCEGGYNNFNPQLVEQEGIVGSEMQIDIVDNDIEKARPEYMENIPSFLDEWHENHYVKFYAQKIGNSKVEDYKGNTLTIRREDGFYSKILPGNIGDILEISGVHTQNDDNRIFRCATVEISNSGYPPFSYIDDISLMRKQGSVTIYGYAEDPDGIVNQVEFFYRYSDDNCSWEDWESIGVDYEYPWIIDFSFPEGYGYYEFYSVSKDNSGNFEDSPVRPDFSYKNLVNQPPDIPTNPNPYDGKTQVSIYSKLFWTGTDPDGDELNYDIYLGTINPPPKVASYHLESNYDPGSLLELTNYYWKIVSRDEHDETTEGPIWTFTTAAAPPKAPMITGPKTGKVGEKLIYGFATIDPNEYDIFYYVDWGDETNTGWMGPFDSGESITEDHTWEKKGTYVIKAKAKNNYGGESEWSYLGVIIPKSKNINIISYYYFLNIVYERFPIIKLLITKILEVE
jgi:5'-nucleotidase/2',3'-cyclic-nucleotide 2'-phosphodiesterase/3'-nucleotidase